MMRAYRNYAGSVSTEIKQEAYVLSNTAGRNPDHDYDCSEAYNQMLTMGIKWLALGNNTVTVFEGNIHTNDTLVVALPPHQSPQQK